MIKKKRLGDILLDVGFISQDELFEALEVQEDTDKRLGRVLIDMGLITELDVVKALEQQLGITKVELRKIVISPEIINLIPQDLAQQSQAVPISKQEGSLRVAMADPLDVVAIDDIQRETGYEVEPVIATQSEIQQALDQYFGNDEEVDKMIREIDSSDSEEAEMGLDQLKEAVEEAPVVRLVNNIINEGVRLRASDIHIDPQDEEIRVRYRVDGILHTEMNIPRNVHSALISRIKIMADLDIAERRLPQDGRIKMIVEDREVDLRISTLPTVRGEKLVIRVLDKEGLMLDLKKLGFVPEHLKSFKSMIQQAHGMVLITGPTGSGKTTTLYSALSSLDTETSNVITVEDPVEYRLEGVNQVQISEKKGLTFSRGLRSILRQDPDIVMVGEIRDQETAQIAIHAALTGHLVFSTLHTNEAAGAISRLIDMGVEPFLVASAVKGVVAQRLVRTLCPECKVEEAEEFIDPEIKDYLTQQEKINLYTSSGCAYCNETGYRGRTAIHEILELTPQIQNLIAKDTTSAQLNQAAAEEGMISMEEVGIRKVNQGITTLEEVMRVTKVQTTQE